MAKINPFEEPLTYEKLINILEIHTNDLAYMLNNASEPFDEWFELLLFNISEMNSAFENTGLIDKHNNLIDPDKFNRLLSKYYDDYIDIPIDELT